MKNISKYVKRYGIWIGALSGTFSVLHYLRLDGFLYWGWIVKGLQMATTMLLGMIS